MGRDFHSRSPVPPPPPGPPAPPEPTNLPPQDLEIIPPSSEDLHIATRRTAKKKSCFIGLFAVLSLVIVIVAVVVAVKTHVFGSHSSGGFSCTTEQLLLNCDTCSASDMCKCKHGFHHPPNDQ